MQLTEIFAAADHAAALVYHQIVAAENNVAKWEDAHPAVKPFLDMGETYLSALLLPYQAELAPVLTIGNLLMSSLKAMAANDDSMRSGGTQVAGAAKVPDLMAGTGAGGKP